MNDHEEIKKALREACGFIDPVIEPQAPPSYTELASERALMVWDTIMARNGSMPEGLNGEQK